MLLGGASADRFYSDSWKSTIAQRYGAQPEILFYETPVIVENADENAASAASCLALVWLHRAGPIETLIGRPRAVMRFEVNREELQ
jgi:hypothetical protein